MNDHSQWIEAAKALIENPYSQVLCPSCGLAFLAVEDRPVDDTHFERHMKCPCCGSQEFILKKNVS